MDEQKWMVFEVPYDCDEDLAVVKKIGATLFTDNYGGYFEGYIFVGEDKDMRTRLCGEGYTFIAIVESSQLPNRNRIPGCGDAEKVISTGTIPSVVLKVDSSTNPATCLYWQSVSGLLLPSCAYMFKNVKPSFLYHDTVMFVDLFPLMISGHFKFGGVKDNRGRPVGMLYGVLYSLLRIYDRYSPTAVFISADVVPSFRKELYPKFKASKGSHDTDKVDLAAILERSFPIIMEILQGLGMIIAVPNKKYSMEAGDVIGTLSKLFSSYDRIILTSDVDTLQCIDSNKVTVERVVGRKRKMYNINTLSVFPVPYKYTNVYRAFEGVVSDDVPGVQGVCESLPGVLQRFKGDFDSPKFDQLLSLMGADVRVKAEKHLPQAIINYELLEHRIEFGGIDYYRLPPDEGRVLKLCKRMNLRGFMGEMRRFFI